MVKFDFSQIEYGLIAFVENIERKMQEMIPDIPVYVLQTGDTSYMLNSKFQNNDVSEIYEKVPRLVITFDSFSHEQDMDTNLYNRFDYFYENENYTTQFRRVQLDVTTSVILISSNFIKALEHMNMLLSIFTRQNVLTYQFCGHTYEGAFSADNMQEVEFPEMDQGTRNFKQKLDVTLQLHIYTPRVETIEIKKQSKVEYDLNVND